MAVGLRTCDILKNKNHAIGNGCVWLCGWNSGIQVVFACILIQNLAHRAQPSTITIEMTRYGLELKLDFQRLVLYFTFCLSQGDLFR